MQSKDLRIGNLVIVDSTIVKMKIEYFGRNIKPLPIDATRLQEFGFVKRSDFNVYTNIWELKGFMVSLGDYINIHVDWAEEIGRGYHSIRCYEELFSHELQNLYFALTGEELELKSESKP